MSPFQLFLALTSSDQSTAGIAFRHGVGAVLGFWQGGQESVLSWGNLIPLGLGKVFTGRNFGRWHWEAVGVLRKGT